jgi:hypothetical protein
LQASVDFWLLAPGCGPALKKSLQLPEFDREIAMEIAGAGAMCTAAEIERVAHDQACSWVRCQQLQPHRLEP